VTKDHKTDADGLVERIKADREAGTPGPWTINECESYGDRCKTFYKEVWNDKTDILVTTEVTRAHNDGGNANLRRIASVPDMEARILADAKVIKAAEELAEQCEAAFDGVDAVGNSDFYKALAAFNAALAEQEKDDE